MRVKGTAIVARRQTVMAEFGAEAWDAFWRDFTDTHAPELAHGVLPTATVPAETFLALSDALVERFYAGDPRAYWRFGVESASWALVDGPYANFVGTRDVASFLEVAPALWRAYYSAGAFTAKLAEDRRLVRARIESPVRHVHFEFSVMGFVERALTLVGADVMGHEVVRGFSRGDDHVHYRFELAEPVRARE